MECPVCYCDTDLVHLTCGHHLCTTCTKRWYIQHEENATCPMCRDSLCFRGIIHKKKVWNSERCEQVYTDLINEIVEDCTPDCIPVLSLCISKIQERYTFVMNNYPEVNKDDMELILRYSWIPLECERGVEYDVPTYIQFLFVNRTEYGNLSRFKICNYQDEIRTHSKNKLRTYTVPILSPPICRV
jgi:hypothetical protein